MIKVNFNAYASYVTDSIYQWDINRQLTVEGLNLETAPEVHFSNSAIDGAIVRQASYKDFVVNVDIPNSLLQMPLTIKAHIGVYEGKAFKTVEVVEIPVIPRKRPLDYRIEDTDEEIHSFKALENMIANKADNSRVDYIIAHNNDTAGNTELTDIRVGADGANHGSAGTAVREQFNKISHDLKNNVVVLPVDVSFKSVNGYYNADLEYVELNYYHTIEPVPCETYDTFIVNTTEVGAAAYKVALFDENKNIIAVDLIGKGSNTTYTEIEYTVFKAAKYISFTAADTYNFYVKKKKLISVFDNNPLSQKILGGLGDSLMTSAYTAEGTEWLSLIGNRNNMTVYNYAISGNPIACVEAANNNGTEVVGMSGRFESMAEGLDYIIVMGGANDFNYSVPIGENSDTTVYTFKGALNVLINGLIEKYPAAKIVFCTNYRRYNTEDEKMYVDAMIEVCGLHSIPCHNNYTSSNCHFDNEQWMSIFGADSENFENKHLNGLGDERVSYMYESLLKSL